ncbi:Hsp20 family protein [Frateuria sp. MAH-13]|uniref:Hsp20 family protein n=1 Tax=Frateuria flava TaxID=2821489 RepID=A0ABS4DIB7_9GAMM|nr:Hsp20 family protein [Frateuria flava]MBP1472801.1 Hsp20 family protein [Frateuria flava]
MRTMFDLAPLHRSSIGFDRIFDMLENATRVQAADNWPPYDTVKLSEDRYRITMAVAGFRRDELDIALQPNLLVVTGERRNSEQQGDYLYRGIASRSFSRRFELADHVKVTGANLADGLLTIELEREIPEAMRPRRIAIGNAGADAALESSGQRQLEAQAA